MKSNEGKRVYPDKEVIHGEGGREQLGDWISRTEMGRRTTRGAIDLSRQRDESRD